LEFFYWGLGFGEKSGFFGEKFGMDTTNSAALHLRSWLPAEIGNKCAAAAIRAARSNWK
jgi:hypothetical protein